MRPISKIVGVLTGLAILTAAGPAAGQAADGPLYDHDRDEVEVLFEDAEVGGYGGPEFRISSVGGQPGTLLGGRGGVVINHVFTIGAGGYGMINSPKPGTSIAGNTASLGLGYGGVYFEGMLFPESVVHPTVGAMFGGGGASYQFEARELDDISTSIFVVDSFVSAELNLTTFARLLVGVDYRAVFGVDLPNLDNGDLSGPGGHVMLKFGGF